MKQILTFYLEVWGTKYTNFNDEQHIKDLGYGKSTPCCCYESKQVEFSLEHEQSWMETVGE